MPELAVATDRCPKTVLSRSRRALARENMAKLDDLQQSLYELAKSTLGARDGFQAIYLAFLGKPELMGCLDASRNGSTTGTNQN